jgi:hypothetical protein
LRTPAPLVASNLEGRSMPDDIKPLNTPEASKYFLGKWNYKISPHTLETYRSRGGGPEYFCIGTNVLYWPADLDAWVLSRMTPKVGSASEARQIRLARRKLIQDETKKRKTPQNKASQRKSKPRKADLSKSKPIKASQSKAVQRKSGRKNYDDNKPE